MADADPEHTGLAAAHAPPAPGADPGRIAAYVESAMHQDRTPGNVVVVRHPLRTYKVPRPLLPALEAAGYALTICDTQPDRATSVRGIRDALVRLAAEDAPLDLLVIAGDGTLDHHVLVAAFWAFYPDLVVERGGTIDLRAVTDDLLATLPPRYRATSLGRVPDTSTLVPDEATIREIWGLRADLERHVRAGRSIRKLEAVAGAPISDVKVRVAALAALFPQQVRLRADGFDLSGLAEGTQQRTFQGLYPFLRSIAVYPAGTAADNALFAGIPGWTYAQASKRLAAWQWLDGMRRRWEARATERFVRCFRDKSAVVPARWSLVSFDGDWQVISSHAVGGPGSGHVFAADLRAKTSGLTGYLIRLPGIILREGILGSTLVQVTALDGEGQVKTSTEAQLSEGLYTNRTFIGGIASIPSTDPTSFAGQSTFAVVPPILGRGPDGSRQIDLHGLFSVFEGATKGIVGRLMHLLGIDPGTLAGGGRIRSAWPQHLLTLHEGEEVQMRYRYRDRSPRAVPTQVSGDPFQASEMAIRVAWGPLPLLAHTESLLLASARRALAHLRQQQTWRLRGVFIGGLHWFRHDTGEHWSPAFAQRTGLSSPLLLLPPGLGRIQRACLDAWESAGDFVDTSDPGLGLGRRGRYAHNNEGTAHLIVLRERRDTLLVRQVRKGPVGIHETRTFYRGFGPSWVIHSSHTREWVTGQDPRILHEVHFFRTAEAFQRDAPSFFPFVGQEGDRGWADITEEIGLE